MAKGKARDDEIQDQEEAAAVVQTKRRTTTKTGAIADSSSGVCDDVLRGIFARVPARTAVASMALSKHPRSLMRCPDFIDLHCRLSPPLPRPHVAYVATANVRRSGGAGVPVSGYHGFHVAGGAGLSSSGGNAPMRALAGPTYLGKRYVNTCNGVVLLAGKPRPNTCVLWNPAVADEEKQLKQVTVPVSEHDDCAILGLGYGPRSKTYKLLLTRRRMRRRSDYRDPPRWNLPRLMVYTLGGKEKQPLQDVPYLTGPGQNISGESIYMDGTIYFLYVRRAAILVFHVDGERLTDILLPGERWDRQANPTLLLMSGRPCVGMEEEDNHGMILWLLTAEHHWERRCTIKVPVSALRRRGGPYSFAGVWDCGGVLAMYSRTSRRKDGDDDKLFLYCTATETMTGVNLPFSMTPERSDYAFCWGYKPTLVSPGSIIGELDQDEERRRRDRTADMMAALEPFYERGRRKGQKATLDTVCFMEFLLRTLQKLPENMQDVVEMPLLKSEDSDPEPEPYISYADPGYCVKNDIANISDSDSSESDSDSD